MDCFCIRGTTLLSFFEHSMNFIDQASKYGKSVQKKLVRRRPALKYAIRDTKQVVSITYYSLMAFASLFWYVPLLFNYLLGYFAVIGFSWWTKYGVTEFLMSYMPSSVDEACEWVLRALCMSLYVVIPVLSCWMFALVVASIYGIETERRMQQWLYRLWLLQERTGFSFDPQMGDLETKADRHRKFCKNKEARVKGRIRKTGKGKKWRPGRGETFTPQLGSIAVAKALTNLANIRGIPITPDVLNKVEDLIAFYVAAKDCSTTSGFLATTFLYLKTHYHKSVADSAMTYITEYLDATFDAQTGEIDVAANDDKPSWLLLLKEVQANWALVIRNEGFKKISHVLSLCLALGLCDAADLDFQVGGMKLFSIGAYTKQATAVDLVDAAFETIVHFTEGGYMCFERKSLKPLLYGNMECEEFEEKFAKCLRCHEYARCGNLEKYEGMTENDYEALLVQCIEKVQMLITTSRGVIEKNIFRRKLDTLRQWQATFRQTRVQGGLREAPYSIGVFGGTAVGKSTIANILMVTTLMRNGYAATDDRIVTLNERDKFMSNYRSYTNGVLIDDIGNTKPDFVEKAPTTLMLELVNNVRMYANMAEADMKGKVSVEPKVVIGTKNVKDTCATVYSNEPASITRRDRITLTCRVREEYAVHDMLNEDKIRALHPEGTPLIPDFWLITVEKSFPVKNKTKGKAATVGWEVVEWHGRPLEDISLAEFIRWCGQDSEKFYRSQKEFVENQTNLAGKLVICPECKFPKPDVCQCDTPVHHVLHKMDSRCVTGYCTSCEAYHQDEFHDSEEEFSDDESSEVFSNQLGEKLVAAMLPRVRRWDRWWHRKTSYWTSAIESRATEMLLERLDWLETSRWVRWTNWMPTEWIEKDWMKNVVWFTHKVTLEERIRRAYLNHIFGMILIVALSCVYSWYLLNLLFLSLAGIAGVVACEKKKLYTEVSEDNKAMPKVFKMYRNRHVKWITGACLVIASLYALSQIWKAVQVVPTAQGNLAPTSMVEIKERDAEVNPWAGAFTAPMPCSDKSKTTTPDQLEGRVFENLCHMHIQVDDSGKERHFECDAFFPKSNVALVPQHMWITDDVKAKFTRHSPTDIGGNFECFLYRKNSVDIPNTDLSLVWVPNGGDWKDLTDYLPLDRFADVPARLIYKKADGTSAKSKLRMECGDVTTYAASFFGAKYDLTFETFEGLCMAPIVTETKGPLIGGFHLGGKNGETRGCCGLLTSGQFEKAFEALGKKPNVVLAKSAGTIPTKLYDVQFFESTDIHPKSPINFLPHGTNCKYYGQVKGRVTYKTEVNETVISKHVEDVCGVPQKWGGPKFGTWQPWQASLQFSTKPSCGIEGSLLEKASEDYTKTILEMLDDIPGLTVDVRPLTEMEVICGRDGIRFIDKMPPSTSIGYPLSGPKSNFMTLCDPEDYPTHQCPAILDQRFWDHAYEMEELYLQGLRAYPIFKACLKDEPTKLDKDKVRVFQGAPIALQLLIRKYYLPIARILSMLPLTSECAVGINAQGPEWDQLAKHVATYGKERILAGDYSKYDLRMPAQVMFAAFRIMMDIGRHCGYSERDLAIMEGIATDVCYPLMAYNGDLIQHYGSNPSGQNLTVYINSIVNALLFRCAYYHICKNRKDLPEFRNVCSLITYGDDAKSSVEEAFPEFNHIAVAKFLEDRDMKFTMPDKTSNPTPYMHDDEADLLKRANIYSEDTGMIMGALDEDSIFKSLHAVLRSKAITPEQQAMQNIDGALREWFAYGRDHYEMRREQMLEVAKRADIAHGCTVLYESYDDRLQTWKERYE